MKTWSRYNHLFHSERFGYFLYNALSNIMLELDEAHFTIVEDIRDGRQGTPLESDKAFFELLKEKGFLASEEDERLQLMQLRYQRNVACFSTAHLGLTICPTLTCNFTCSYCFEHSQNDVKVMNPNTIDALISFVKKHQDAENLSVNWYGGEPTIVFNVIKSLTERFLELYPDYENAGLVTNGYSLDKTKIEQLTALKISSVQITLDGIESTHNNRRMLKNGKPTYRKILENIDALMHSSWKGSCAIRVNIDKTNLHEYPTLRKELLERYKGKKLTVYTGHINTFVDHSYDHKCGLCNTEWAEFTIGLYKKEGIIPRGGFYPTNGALNTCITTSQYGYVIGPEGEIYKCWEDVGKEQMVIGSIYDDQPVSNAELVARYSIGTDPFDDEACIKCPVMPVCGGGCANKRMRSQQFGEEGLEFCSPLKNNLTSYLEAYLDIKQTDAICASILSKKSFGSTMKRGYQMIQPERTEAQNGV